MPADSLRRSKESDTALPPQSRSILSRGSAELKWNWIDPETGHVGAVLRTGWLLAAGHTKVTGLWLVAGAAGSTPTPGRATRLEGLAVVVADVVCIHTYDPVTGEEWGSTALWGIPPT